MRTATIRYCWTHASSDGTTDPDATPWCEFSQIVGQGADRDCDITQAAIAEILPYATYEETTITDQPAPPDRQAAMERHNQLAGIARGFDGSAMDYRLDELA